MSDSPLLELRAVSKDFSSGTPWLSRLLPATGSAPAPGPAVDRVSLSVNKGEVLGLVGESGSGKSTLARLAIGLHRLSSGSRCWKGQNLDALPERERRLAQLAMQMVFQDPYASLNPRLPVKELIGEAPRVHGLVPRSQQEALVADLLTRVGLDPGMMRRYPHQFSGGQRARIGIARALALQPELLICDEAVAALDVSIQAQVLDLFMDLRQQLALTCLFISHDLAVVRHVSDRVAVMYRGRLVELGPAQALFENPLHPYTRMLLASAPKLEPGPKNFSTVEHAVPASQGPLHEAAPGHFVADLPG